MRGYPPPPKHVSRTSSEPGARMGTGSWPHCNSTERHATRCRGSGPRDPQNFFVGLGTRSTPAIFEIPASSVVFWGMSHISEDMSARTTESVSSCECQTPAAERSTMGSLGVFASLQILGLERGALGAGVMCGDRHQISAIPLSAGQANHPLARVTRSRKAPRSSPGASPQVAADFPGVARDLWPGVLCGQQIRRPVRPKAPHEPEQPPPPGPRAGEGPPAHAEEEHALRSLA